MRVADEWVRSIGAGVNPFAETSAAKKSVAIVAKVFVLRCIILFILSWIH